MRRLFLIFVGRTRRLAVASCLCAIVVVTAIGLARSHGWWPQARVTTQGNGITPRRTSLKITPAEANFGEVIKGTNLTRQFKITNIADHQVSLSIQASCGCTAVVLGATELRPGASTTMKVDLSTEGMQGPFSKTVTVSTGKTAGASHVGRNGDRHVENEQNLSVIVSGRSVPIIEVTPSSVSFGEVRHKRDAVRDFELRTLKGKNLMVKEVTVTANTVIVQPLTRSSSARAAYRVSLPPDIKSGQIFDTIKVTFSSPAVLTEIIPVTGVYTGDLSATPPRLFYDKLTDENWKEVVLEAKIEALDGKSFTIKKLTCNNDRFAATVEPAGDISGVSRPASRSGSSPSNSFLLKVKLTQPIPESFTQTWVTIEADLSEDAVLEIPVSIARKK